MSRLTGIYEQFDVVKVPFPFIDKNTTKRRPALVLSPLKGFNALAGASILAMITSVKADSSLNWPMDLQIRDIEEAGLPCPSLIRWKLFTLDHRLILGRLGTLSGRDREEVANTLRDLFVTL